MQFFIMKNFFLLFLIVAGLVACTNNVSTKTDTLLKGSDNHSAQAIDLKLNNGAKWNSDESTNENVLALQTIVNRHKAANNAGKDYTPVREELQKGLEKMIKECRMKGADHDALHSWLLPLQQNIKGLQTATNPNEAEQNLITITQQLSVYNQYFE